jgi:hypothetical protein
MFFRCRPVALFIPLAAIVFSLKNCEGYIRAILIKQLESEKLSRGAGKTLQRPYAVPSMSVRLAPCNGWFVPPADNSCKMSALPWRCMPVIPQSAVTHFWR